MTWVDEEMMLEGLLAQPRFRALEALARPEGVLMAELCDATGWQPHTARAFCSRLGEQVISWKTSEGRRYGFEQEEV
jgi:hypothetical protein